MSRCRPASEACYFSLPCVLELGALGAHECSCRSWLLRVAVARGGTCCTPTTHHRRANPTRTSLCAVSTLRRARAVVE
eukprot:6998757-Prymnesium_polylepis.3